MAKKSINHFVFSGHLGANPNMRYTNNGELVANFSVACNEADGSASWFTVVAFGKLAEISERLLMKGTHIVVEGRIRIRKWEKDGITKWFTEVMASDVTVIDKGRPYVEVPADARAEEPAAPAEEPTEAPAAPAAPTKKPAETAPKRRSPKM